MAVITTQIMRQIREKCQQEKWFGPDLLGPRYATVSTKDSRRIEFAYPPATEEQLQETQHFLGVALPPLLTALFHEIANGGFGPGAGILGVAGGYRWNEQTLVDAYKHSRKTYVVDLQNHWMQWPTGMIPLCDMGDVNTLCVDTHSGLVLNVAPTDHPRGIVPVMSVEFPSVEEWLNEWIQS